MFEPSDIEKLNTDIELWDDKNKAAVINEMDTLGIKRYPYSQNPVPLRKAFKSKLRKRFDLINKISYSMPRSAVFLHKGVSRSHGKNHPRTAKEWYEPVVDRNIDELADVVAEGQGNLIVNALKIK